MTVSTVPLADFCEVLGGGRLKLTGADFVEKGVPAYGAGGRNGYVTRAEFDRPGIILSSIGARCGKCFYVEGEWSTLANTQIILPDPAVADVRFLWHQLNDEGSWHRSGTAQPFIKPTDVRARTVVLPDLSEQRRIAGVLDLVAVLHTQRRRSFALLDDLVRSIFFDMFPAATSDAWNRTTVGDLVDDHGGGIRTGPFGSQLLHSEFVDEGIPVLGIDNVVENRFRWGKARHITEQKYRELRRYTVRPGDVLITIMGTCGRAAVAPDDIPVSINTKHLCCITLDQSRCLPPFLHSYFLFHPEARSYLERTAKGAIMSGLNMGIVKALPVRLPPIGLQRQFVEMVDAVRRYAAVQEAAAKDSAVLLASLHARAFRGEL